MNKQPVILDIIIAFFIGGILGWGVRSTLTRKPSPGIVYSRSALELRQNMRELWTDHVVWTRLFILSSLAKAQETEKVVQRLFRNQTDIGNLFKPYYGNEVGDRLGKLLLKDHILIAADIVEAAEEGKQEKLAVLEERWKKNAEDITDFLGRLNSQYKKGELLDMLLEHLRFTKEELVARLQKDYNKDIEAFDEAVEDVLKMADF